VNLFTWILEVGIFFFLGFVFIFFKSGFGVVRIEFVFGRRSGRSLETKDKNIRAT
jgi:hypothetical protein